MDLQRGATDDGTGFPSFMEGARSRLSDLGVSEGGQPCLPQTTGLRQGTQQSPPAAQDDAHGVVAGGDACQAVS